MTGENAILLFTGYLIGSIPFAYLLVRRSHGFDLRQMGSRNIGARNAFEVTGKKSIGVLVLFLDVLKGFLPIYFAELQGLTEILPLMALAIVLGHCYPIWLKFHGGRGLATAAGAMIAVAPVLIGAWLLFYGLIGRLYKNVHVDALAAIVLSAALVLLLPDAVLNRAILTGSGETVGQVRVSVVLILSVLSTRHFQPVIVHLTGSKRNE